jgi:hypothetical protein
VCVTLVEKVGQVPPTPTIQFPLNNIGGGNPIIANLQGREHVATISCLVSDGHRIYALTNRHVAGDPAEVVYSNLSRRTARIGVSSGKQLTRLPFVAVYRDFPGKDVYLNLDAGLIDIDDLSAWTAQVHGIGTLGRLADLPPTQMKLSLVGCRVVGFGAASGRMEGEITALLYRYKSIGGFEYLADFLIGPRSGRDPGASRIAKQEGSGPELLTRPGDSGTLWVFDPVEPNQKATITEGDPELEYRPFAVQWGAQVFAGDASTYALATSLSTICSLLDLDLVRDWNLDEIPTWGSIGHFSIAASVTACLTNARLKALMTKNADIISPSDDDIRSSEFKGMGSDDFVPLSDVPDMFWKPRVAKQGFARAMEGPNHFADMDQERKSDGKTLLDLTRDEAFVDPEKWDEFYSSVTDLLSGKPITSKHRGLLPFRVWQIFNDMVRFVNASEVTKFVCAAGVLTHYVGDACQPLHISYLHDGDPEQPQTRTIHHRDGTEEEKIEPLGSGVHSAYEDSMISAHRAEILDGLKATEKVKAAELIHTGLEAAKGTISMMRTVFKRVPPRKIVQFYIDSEAKPKQLAEDMWEEFGEATIKCMQDGAHLLAVIWQSAWVAGHGDGTVSASALKSLNRQKAMEICKDENFLPSMSIDRISDVLR